MDFTDAMCSGRMEEVEEAEKDKWQGGCREISKHMGEKMCQ